MRGDSGKDEVKKASIQRAKDKGNCGVRLTGLWLKILREDHKRAHKSGGMGWYNLSIFGGYGHL